MVNDLIKMCQEDAGFKSCEKCILFNRNGNYASDLICLCCLIKVYNKKYDTKLHIEERKE